MNEIKEITQNLRRDLLNTVYNNRTGHLASSLSCADILVELYFDNVLRYRPKDPWWDERDRFILSKGHAALALYYCLAYAGFFDKEEVATFCKPGTRFGGLAVYGKIPGIEMSSGSLGHGLSFGAGVALAAKKNGKNYATYTLLGEGELDEGENWEAALFIAHQNLMRHTVIVEINDIQATGFNRNILNLKNIGAKWKAFGFEVIEINGHDHKEIKDAFLCKTEMPKVIIAHTKKGKGLSFLEGCEDCHYHIPSDEEYKLGIKELLDSEEH